MADGLILDRLEVMLGGACLLGLTARIAPGEVLTLMGPSGVGKSALLSALTGTLDAPLTAAGSARLAGTEITRLPSERRRLGILFQESLLFPHLSVAGNLAFALPPGSRAQRNAAIEAALSDVGLPGFGHRDPATLSGGEQARVALMRTLLAEPRALLLDEPFSRLDAARREEVRQLVFDRAQARGLPVLMVTHDAEDARAAGGPVVEAVPGQIVGH
ncbi:ATP-binding cassette domain-containing protein [Vannielia litorea]|uniref:Putative thiamine transport system ATP-binding protein n=1 Tax=Vannielia litorea TaxID=1217970 RepID=A0A1N6FNL5_9RHOB|nr:ATP-binding cassette domain-containing protein [Vannielia litorea]SIN96790.1 putative thiamine transport system ATP-binding protein [Vannielia litorea]